MAIFADSKEAFEIMQYYLTNDHRLVRVH